MKPNYSACRFSFIFAFSVFLVNASGAVWPKLLRLSILLHWTLPNLPGCPPELPVMGFIPDADVEPRTLTGFCLQAGNSDINENEIQPAKA